MSPTTTHKATSKPSTAERTSVTKCGVDLLRDPQLNKSTASTKTERLGLVGMVPDVTKSEDLQLRRVMQQLGKKTADLERS